MSDHTEHRLIAIEGAPESPARSLDRRRGKRLTKEAPRTSAGHSAGDLIGAWAGWYEGGSGVPIPPSTKARMGKHVKALISAGYSSTEIKWGLSFWTIEQLEDDFVSPAAVENIVWRIALDTRAGAREWCEQMKEQVRGFSAETGIRPARRMSWQEARDARSDAALANLKRKRGEL